MAEFLKRIAERIGDRNTRDKLFASYLLFISVPLMIFSLLTYAAVSGYYEKQIRFSAEQSIEQARTFLAGRIGDLVKTSDIVYFGSEVQKILTASRRDYEQDFSRQYIDYLALDRFLTNFKDTHDIYRVTLYVPGWYMFANQKINFDNLDHFRDSPEFKRLSEENEKVLWIREALIDDANPRDTVGVFSLLRKVRNTNRLDEVIGVVKISIREQTVASILEKANTTRNGMVLLRNDAGSILCSIGGGEREARPLASAIGALDTAAEFSWKPLSVGGIGCTVSARGIGNTDWTLATAIPDSEIRYRGGLIRRTMLGLLTAIAIGSFIAASFFSRSATNRIRELTAAMDRVRSKALDVELAEGPNDEIGKMVRSFNYMVRRMKRLVKERYRAGQAVKSAELRALQAQINPHFLHNTLDLINWKAIEKGAPEIAEISRTLASFYNLSLNDGRDIVTVGDELEHVASYARIQNLRFGDRITLIVDVPDAIRRFGMPKIILQPLVENSILHGILEKGDDATGMIRISARREKKVGVLSIEDDGVGIGADKMDKFLSRQETDGERRGYGIRNINDRIKLRFGERYGLAYRNREGGGTIAEIRIPAGFKANSRQQEQGRQHV